jgi:DNA replication protein DnaC
VEDCKDLSFLDQKKNILMYGNPGTGKTMLAICTGIQACRTGIPVRFFRTESLISKLKEAHKEGRLTAFKEKHSSARLIILDEFGYIPYDLEGAQLLFNFISEYYQKSSIIMTTNKEFSEWREILVDLKLTKAFVGWIIHHCELVVFPGEDWRISNSNISKMYKTLMKEADLEDV